MMKLILSLLFVSVLPITVIAQIEEMDDSIDVAVPALTNQEEVYAEVNTQVDGVDFKSWESDFNKSVETQGTECTGKNCKFKNKQAFDPSWDL